MMKVDKFFIELEMAGSPGDADIANKNETPYYPYGNREDIQLLAQENGARVQALSDGVKRFTGYPDLSHQLTKATEVFLVR